MSKKAFYRGQKFDVVSEDDSFVTLEGYGYKKRHLKDEVVFEEAPEDELYDEYPDKDVITDVPKDELYDEYPDKGFLEEDKDQIQAKIQTNREKIADLKQDQADSQEEIAALESEITQLSKNNLEDEKKEAGEDLDDTEIVQRKTTLSSQLPGMTEGDDMKDKNTTMSAKEWDKYKEQGVDVDPESHQETQGRNDDIMKGALEGLRRTFRQTLNEIDDILEENVEEDRELNGEVYYDEDRVTQDVNYSDLDNHYSNLDDENLSYPIREDASVVDKFITNVTSSTYSADDINNPDELEKQIKSGSVPGWTGPVDGGPGQDPPEAININVDPETGEILGIDSRYLQEDAAAGGAATVTAAGPGQTDATINQAINGQGGVAPVPTKIGMGIQRRKAESMYKESVEKLFKIEDEFIFESKHAIVSRHKLAESVEESIDPLTESECNSRQRTKARMESIGRYATLRECASFIAENKFSCSDGKYIPREKGLDMSAVYEMMQRKNKSAIKHLKKA